MEIFQINPTWIFWPGPPYRLKVIDFQVWLFWRYTTMGIFVVRYNLKELSPSVHVYLLYFVFVISRHKLTCWRLDPRLLSDRCWWLRTWWGRLATNRCRALLSEMKQQYNLRNKTVQSSNTMGHLCTLKMFGSRFTILTNHEKPEPSKDLQVRIEPSWN